MKSPRVQVSLDPELYDIIVRIARGTDQSASGFIASMLDQQREVLGQIASTVDRARQLSAPLSGSLTIALAKGEREAQELVHSAQANLDQLSMDLNDELQSQSDGRVSGAPRGERRLSDPLTINKGVYKRGLSKK